MNFVLSLLAILHLFALLLGAANGQFSATSFQRGGEFHKTSTSAHMSSGMGFGGGPGVGFGGAGGAASFGASFSTHTVDKGSFCRL